MCICVSLSAYVTLFCLFSPKISIILLHPDKNVRKLTMNSATYKRPFRPVPHATASAEARLNATSATYNGAQTDGCSGGPMSTTSQVLNLGECPTQANQQNPQQSTWFQSLRCSCVILYNFLRKPTCWWPSLKAWLSQCCSVGDLGRITDLELDSMSS